MTQLLSDVLTLVSAEAGRLECNPERTEMPSFCLNLIEDIQLLSKEQHTVKFTLQSQNTYARVDKKLLYSILSNLLTNAIKYSPQGGTVESSLHCEPYALMLQVTDQGIGIPLESLHTLCEPF